MGLCEELCKALPLFWHFRRKSTLDVRGAVVWGLATGIGFGVSEGISYSSSFYNGIFGGGIYIVRSIALAWYFTLPATPATTLLFGAIMGFLWMGVGPLVAGAVVEMFGLKWQAMIQGLAFMSHQLGSFLGAYGGGLIYDSLGSYNMAWRVGVALGLAGGIIQVAFALIRPSEPPMVAATK